MPYRATSTPIATGKPGLRAKIHSIRALVEKAKRDPEFRRVVAELVHNVPEKDHTGEITELLEFTKGGIRYLRDPWSPTGLELFIDPRTQLQDVLSGTAAGDCDDHVILASALLETAGYPTRYVVGGVPPDHYRHIWIEVQHPKQGWLPAELTKKDWPTFADPQGKFPLVERFEGGARGMLGLGQPGGVSRGGIALTARRRAAGTAVQRRARAQQRVAKLKRRQAMRTRPAPSPYAGAGQAERRAELERHRATMQLHQRGATKLERQQAKGRMARAQRGFGPSSVAQAGVAQQHAAAVARERQRLGPGSTTGRSAFAKQRLRIQAGSAAPDAARRRGGRVGLRLRRPGARGGPYSRLRRMAQERRGGLGELEAPPSFHNTHAEDALYAGSTPADFFRATEIRAMLSPDNPLHYSSMLGFDGVLEDFDAAHSEFRTVDDLGGIFKKAKRQLKRSHRRVKRETKRTGRKIAAEGGRVRWRRIEKEVGRSGRKIEKETQRYVINYGPETAAILALVLPGAGTVVAGLTGAALEVYRQRHLAKKAMEEAERASPYDFPPEIMDELPPPQGVSPQTPPNPTPVSQYPSGPSIPASVMSPMPGPSFVAAAEGFALPPGVPDQVAYADDGYGGYQEEALWDEPLPGAGVGSWIPTPPVEEFPNAPAFDPFDMPADGVDGGDVDPGFGEGYGSAEWFSDASYDDAEQGRRHYGDLGDGDMELENTYGSLGAESWLSQFAKSAADTVLKYQAGRLARKASEKGYAPPYFGGSTDVPTPPPATAPMPSPSQFVPVGAVSLPGATRSRMTPAMMMGIGGGALLLLLMLMRKR